MPGGSRQWAAPASRGLAASCSRERRWAGHSAPGRRSFAACSPLGTPASALEPLAEIVGFAVAPLVVGVALALDELRRDRPAAAAQRLEGLLDALCPRALAGPGPPPPAALDALRNLAWARHLLGDSAAALATSERLLAHPGGRTARDLARHAGLLWATGARERARAAMADAAWLDPAEPLVRENQARLGDGRRPTPARLPRQPALTLISLLRDDETGRRVAPGGCLALLAAARAKGRDAALVDCQLLPRELAHEPEALANACGEPGAVIGLSAMADGLPLLVRLCAALRARFPDRVLVAGGPGPSAVAAPLLRLATGLDVVVHGEGEATLVELLERHEVGGREALAGCPGTTVRTPDGLVAGGRRLRTEDLDTLPLAAWDLVDPSDYDEVTLVTSRGCPHRCTFCCADSFWGAGRATRGIDSVLAELEALVDDHGVRHVHIEDDSLLRPRRRLRSLCAGIRERLPGLTWGCLGRADAVDEELLEELVRSGCRSLFLGLESGSDSVLRRIAKGQAAASGLDAARRAARHLPLRASFIWGFPFETRDDFEATFEEIGLLRAEGADATYALLAPLPGTELAQQTAERQLHLGLPFPRLIPEPCSAEDRALVEAHPEVFAAFRSLPTPDWEAKRRFVSRYWGDVEGR